MSTPRFIKIVAVTALVAASVAVAAPSAAAAGSGRVSAWLPNWDQAAGLASFQAGADQYSELSPFWYEATSSGVSPYPNAGDSSVIQAAHAAGVKLMPTVSNAFNGSLIDAIVNDASLRSAHVSGLTTLVTSAGYDGIDVDYENLSATSRDAFSSFIRELASSLHSSGKLLSVTVHAKTSEPGSWSGPQAQDYAAIGGAADVVRVMAYDYSWDSSPAGPIAPTEWVDAVAQFAASVIPPSKVELGLPLYGYDWIGTHGTGVTYSEVESRLARTSATVQWSSTDGEPWFAYSDTQGSHTVWFENAQSIALKLQSVTRYNLKGAVFWRLGGEDPGVWSATGSAFGGGAARSVTTSPDTTAPAVAITSPKPNSPATRRFQEVSFSASDDRGVAIVRLYVDRKLRTTSTWPARSFRVSTSALYRGRHLFSVQAVDAAGNARTANVYVKA